MASTTNRSLAIPLLVIATTSFLTGCDRETVRNLVERLQVTHPEQEGFESHAVREVGVDEHGSRIVEITIVSTRERSWSRASMAYNLVTICGEGRSYTVVNRTPDVDPTDEDAWFADLPAGTQFLERVACEGPLPNQIFGPNGMQPHEGGKLAFDQLKTFFADAPEGRVPGVYVRPGLYGRDHQPSKYDAFHQALGNIMKQGWAECGGSFRVVHLTTVLPRQDLPEDADVTRVLHVGAYLICDNGTLATRLSP